MANYATLKAAIQDVVKTNGNNEITGALLQQSLLAMVNSLGDGFQFIGVATIDTNPGTPDQNVFYIAGAGTYPNFNNAVVADGHIGLFKYNGSWTIESLQVGKNYDEEIAELQEDINGYPAVSETIEKETTAGTPIMNTTYDLPVILKAGRKYHIKVTGIGTLVTSIAFYTRNANDSAVNCVWDGLSTPQSQRSFSGVITEDNLTPNEDVYKYRLFSGTAQVIGTGTLQIEITAAATDGIKGEIVTINTRVSSLEQGTISGVCNLTNLYPLASGQYYQFTNASGANYAPDVLWANHLNKDGMLVKIRVGLYDWQTYVFTGQATASASFKLASRWKKIALSEEIPEPQPVPEDGTEEINLNNVENLVIVGQSHAMGHASLKDKSWLSYLSALTDWVVVNLGADGCNYVQAIDKLLNDSTTNAGAKYSYANKGGICLDFLGGNGENPYFQNGIDGDFATNNIMRFYSMMRSWGYEMIPGTAFGDQSNSISEIQANVAKKLGLQIVDINNICAKLNQKSFLPFWYNAHFGTRTNAVQFVSLLNSIKLRRPKKSIKIYRNRISVASNDKLLYDNPFERWKIWREISINHKALPDNRKNYVDRLDLYRTEIGADVAIASEYQSFKVGNALSITDKGLIEFVLPATAAELKNIKFYIIKTGNASIYVRKYVDSSLAIPLSPASALFSIPDGVSGIAVGDVFTDELNPGVTFTVTQVGADAKMIYCDASGSFSTPGQTTDVLTRSSDSQTFTATSLLAGVPDGYFDAAKKPFGKWESITIGSDGSIVLSDIYKYMDYDKVSFLIDGICSITDIKAVFAKPNNAKEQVFYDYKCSDDLHLNGTPILETAFVEGTMAGTLNNNSGNAVYDNDEETIDNVVMPQIPDYYKGGNGQPGKNATTVLRLMSGDSVSFSIPDFARTIHPKDKVSHYQIRLVCRYYPAPNLNINASSFTIDENTFDFGRIGLRFCIGSITNNPYHTRVLYAPSSFVELIEDVYFDGRSGSSFEIIAEDDNIELLYLMILA